MKKAHRLMRRRKRIRISNGPSVAISGYENGRSPSRTSLLPNLAQVVTPGSFRRIAKHDPSQLLFLQHAYGNRAVQRLIQCKLSVSQPGDRYEREADRVAEAVVQRQRVGAKPTISSVVEKESDITQTMAKGIYGSTPRAPQEDEEESAVMAKASGSRVSHPGGGIEKAIMASRGAGQPLPKSVRGFLESRIGFGFGSVRVHTDSRAVQMTKSLSAEAFTAGTDIYFNSGRYSPATFEGKKLLAHEATHVMQQSKGSPNGALARAGGLPIQRYKLKGFPPAKAAQMHAALASAIATVKGCKKLWWWGRKAIVHSLKRLRYDYVPDLGICGWTFPGSWYVEVGEEAFDVNKCCLLSSTLAHEAAHTELYTEGRARKMECKCFGCSC